MQTNRNVLMPEFVHSQRTSLVGAQLVVTECQTYRHTETEEHVKVVDRVMFSGVTEQ